MLILKVIILRRGLKVRKTRVKEILIDYRKNMDWLSLYEETSSVGASVVGGNSGDGMIQGSQPEGDCMRRQDKREEYEKRKEYNELVDKALDKLPEDQRLVIKYKYNLADIDYLNQFEILQIPVKDIVAYLPFCEATYYKVNKKAHNNLCELFEAIF